MDLHVANPLYGTFGERSYLPLAPRMVLGPPWVRSLYEDAFPIRRCSEGGRRALRLCPFVATSGTNSELRPQGWATMRGWCVLVQKAGDAPCPSRKRSGFERSPFAVQFSPKCRIFGYSNIVNAASQEPLPEPLCCCAINMSLKPPESPKPTLTRPGTKRAPSRRPKPKTYDQLDNGIKRLYPGDESDMHSDVDIVFVPGLGASPEDS